MKSQPRRLHFNPEAVFLHFLVGGRQRSSVVDHQTAESAVLSVACQNNEQLQRLLAVARWLPAVVGGCRRCGCLAVVGAGCVLLSRLPFELQTSFKEMTIFPIFAQKVVLRATFCHCAKIVKIVISSKGCISLSPLPFDFELQTRLKRPFGALCLLFHFHVPYKYNTKRGNPLFFCTCKAHENFKHALPAR